MIRKILALTLAVLGLSLSTTTASAAFAIRIYDGNTLLAQIHDNDGAIPGETATAGLFDDDADINQIEFEELIGGYELIVQGAQSNTPFGNPAELAQQLNARNIDDSQEAGYAINSGILRIIISATGYDVVSILNYLQSDLTVNSLNGTVNVDFQSWVNPSNTLFAQEFSPGIQSLSTLDHLQELEYYNLATTSFSLTSELVLHLNKGEKATATGDTAVGPVPEPGTMALLALGGVGLVGARLRRRKGETVNGA